MHWYTMSKQSDDIYPCLVHPHNLRRSFVHRKDPDRRAAESATYCCTGAHRVIHRVVYRACHHNIHHILYQCAPRHRMPIHSRDKAVNVVNDVAGNGTPCMW
jgi:hypothetical protein